MLILVDCCLQYSESLITLAKRFEIKLGTKNPIKELFNEE